MSKKKNKNKTNMIKDENINVVNTQAISKSQNSDSQKKKNPLSILNEYSGLIGICLSFIGVVITYSAFSYEQSFLSYYNLDIKNIDVDLSTIIYSSVRYFLGTIILLLPIVHISKIIYKREFTLKKLPLIFIYFMFALLGNSIYFNDGFKDVIFTSLGFIVFYLIYGFMFLVSIKSLIKPTEKVITKKSSSELIILIGVAGILFCVFQFYTIINNGNKTAEEKSQYNFLDNNENLIIVYETKSQFILFPYLPETKQIDCTVEPLTLDKNGLKTKKTDVKPTILKKELDHPKSPKMTNSQKETLKTIVENSPNYSEEVKNDLKMIIDNGKTHEEIFSETLLYFSTKVN